MSARLVARWAARLACGWVVLALAGGCRRPTHRASPAASSSAAFLAPSPHPAPKASASVPNADVFADGGAPAGYERATVWDLIPAGDGAAVLLIDPSGTTVLPIFVGSSEAFAIRLDMDGRRYERPLTQDLLSSLVAELGGVAVKTQIDELRDDTFFGSVFFRQGERVLKLDARPSDAIAIALGNAAPIYVSRSVMLGSGVPREQIDKPDKAPELRKRKHGDPISL